MDLAVVVFLSWQFFTFLWRKGERKRKRSSSSNGWSQLGISSSQKKRNLSSCVHIIATYWLTKWNASRAVLPHVKVQWFLKKNTCLRWCALQNEIAAFFFSVEHHFIWKNDWQTMFIRISVFGCSFLQINQMSMSFVGKQQTVLVNLSTFELSNKNRISQWWHSKFCQHFDSFPK